MNRFKLMALAICATFAGQMNAMGDGTTEAAKSAAPVVVKVAAPVVAGNLARFKVFATEAGKGLAANAQAAVRYVADSKVGTNAIDAGRRASAYVANNRITTAKYAGLTAFVVYVIRDIYQERKNGSTWKAIYDKYDHIFGRNSKYVLATIVAFYNLEAVTAFAGKAGSLALATGEFAAKHAKAFGIATKAAGSTALVAMKANKGKTGAAALVTAALAYAGYKYRAQLKAAGQTAGSFVAGKARNAGSVIADKARALKAKLPVRFGGKPAPVVTAAPVVEADKAASADATASLVVAAGTSASADATASVPS